MVVMPLSRAKARQRSISASAIPFRRSLSSTAILLTCISSKNHMAKT